MLLLHPASLAQYACDMNAHQLPGFSVQLLNNTVSRHLTRCACVQDAGRRRC